MIAHHEAGKALARLVLLRVAARDVLDDMACPHLASEYGNCSDCMNTGYAVTCDQEQDLVSGCLTLLRAINSMIGADEATKVEP